MQFRNVTLANGLQIIGEVNPQALGAAVAFWVNTGSRDENANESGVSHFLEHMVFKGTPKRDSFAVNRDFSRIGADNNAYTSEENTVYHATVLPEFLPGAVDILADILRPSLRQADFDTEKQVILDEIVRYEVQPGWATYDNARKIYYREHPLGNTVLGSTQSITDLQRDVMADYFTRRYAPGNITVVVAGKFDWDALVRQVESLCGSWKSTASEPRQCRTRVRGPGGIHVLKKPADKVTQEYVMTISEGPAADGPLRYAAAVLSAAIGDYSGSRLFWALVDPGLADEAGTGADASDGSGTIVTSFNCDPDNAPECLEAVLQILKETQADGITAEELELAKTKIVSREVRSCERTSRRMQTIGQDWVYLNQYRTLDDELAAWDAVDLKAVRAVLEEFPLTKHTTVAYGPCETL